VRFLLDTHVFLWLLAEPERLGEQIQSLEDPANQLLLSAASSWEIAIKSKLGRLKLPDDPQRYVPDSMRAIGVDPLSVDHGHALAVFDLPPHHRDPFDRLLVAQARGLRLPIVTADTQIARYDVETILVSQKQAHRQR
jgi:PIN domain nuclease of toxin-antitoxin system